MATITISPTTAQLEITTRYPMVIMPGVTQAYFGIARSGVTYSNDTSASVNFFDEFLEVVIDDTVRDVDWSGLSIRMGLNDEPSSCSCVIEPRGAYTIDRGHDLQIWLGGYQMGVPLFAGTILQVNHAIPRANSPLAYQVEATDYRWLLDRFARVSARYANQGINTIARNILDAYTDPASNFRLGYVPQSVGTIQEISFESVTVSEAIARLASAVDGGGFWTVLPVQGGGRRVSIYDEPADEGNTLSVADGGTWRNMDLSFDLSQAKNRVDVFGGGSQATARAASSSATISVEETRWYDGSGGTVVAGENVVTYTGLSTMSGPGDLTGCTGIAADIPQGELVRVRARAEDTAAQTALAARIGSSQSGVAVHVESDQGLNDDEAERRAASRLDELKQPNIDLSYEVAPYAQNQAATYVSGEGVLEIRPGRKVTIGITTPLVMNETLRIRSVTLTPRSRRHNGELVWDRSVSAQLQVQRSNESLGLLKQVGA